MRIAYFDCAFGAAGDMLLGALISAGLPVEKWQQELSKLSLPQNTFSTEIHDVIRCTIAAKKLEVLCLPSSDPAGNGSKSKAEKKAANQEKVVAGAKDHAEHCHGNEHGSTKHSHEREAECAEHKLSSSKHSHGNEHGSTKHSHEHEHECAEHKHSSSKHSHEHEHGSAQHEEHHHEHSHGRNLPEILAIIERSPIAPRAKKLASEIFKKLGEAESRVHGMPVEEVHFHEVGAVDAIVDIIGFAIAYDMMGIEKSIVSALPVGSGRVMTQHGLFPVPGPAVLNLLSDAGVPTQASPFSHECLTPTGAAILCTVCERSGTMPAMKVTSTGYGAGTFNPEAFPNVVRVVIGEASELVLEKRQPDASSNFAAEIVAVIETNLDDLSPQVLSFAMEKLLKAGALDVCVTAAVMKKGRSGHLLSVICKPQDRVALQELVLTHTSSIGVRSYFCERLVAERDWVEVEVEKNHKVRVKVARDQRGCIVNAQPEYEDCAEYATSSGLPLKEVIARALTDCSEKAELTSDRLNQLNELIGRPPWFLLRVCKRNREPAPSRRAANIKRDGFVSSAPLPGIGNEHMIED